MPVALAPAIDTTTAPVVPPRTIDFTCDGFELKQALATLKPAVSLRGGALPVLSGVRITADANGVHLLATDLELTIAVTLENAVADGYGVAVVPFGQLHALVEGAAAKKPVTLRANLEADDEMRLDVGKRNRVVRLLAADEFPRLARPAGDEMVAIDAELLGLVLPAVSPDDARPILTGVLVGGESGQIVATDSYRLYVVDGPATAEAMLIPGRAIKQVVRAGGSPLMLTGEREVSFEWPDRNLRITCRLIEGEFPNYRGLIPVSHPNRWHLDDKDTVIEACKASTKFGEPNTPIRITPVEGGFSFKTVVQGVGSEEFFVAGRCEHGDDLTVAFNPAYLGNVVAGLPAEAVLDTVDALKPALFKGERGLLRLLMPVRVS